MFRQKNAGGVGIASKGGPDEFPMLVQIVKPHQVLQRLVTVNQVMTVKNLLVAQQFDARFQPP